MTLDRACRRRRARQDDAPPTRCSTGWPKRGSRRRLDGAEPVPGDARRRIDLRARAHRSSRTWSAARSPIASCSPARASSASRFAGAERARRSGRPAAAQRQRRRHVAARPAVGRPRRGDDQLHRRAGQCGGRDPHGGRSAPIVSSRAFIEKAGLDDIVEAAEKAGAKFVWLEDVRAGIADCREAGGGAAVALAAGRQDADKPAVILFTSGSEGTPKAVVLANRNLARQCPAGARRGIALSPEDKLLNVLPVFHSYGLTGGTILPLLVGVRFFLYPSPLHYKLIPRDRARRAGRPSCSRTDTFLTAYARTADDERFRQPAPGGGRRRSRCAPRRGASGASVSAPRSSKVSGMTEAAPVVAVNTRRMAATARSAGCCPACACSSSRSRASPRAAGCGSPAPTSCWAT